MSRDRRLLGEAAASTPEPRLRKEAPSPYARIDDAAWRIDPTGVMRVPAVLFASPALLEKVEDEATRQLMNVASLPGIVTAAFAMPDVHSGYGFPIGGVAATDVAAGGVISPGGVGFDISCGVRLLMTPLSRDELVPRLDALMDALDDKRAEGTRAWRGLALR